MGALKQLASILPSPIRDPLLRVWRGAHTQPDFEILRMLSDKTRLSIDIGANAGTYVRELARHSKRCIAFEPVPDLAKSVRDLYGPMGVEVHECALSDKSGTVTLHIPIIQDGENPANATLDPHDRSLGENIRSIEVDCHRLDDFSFETVGVMKIDAEGHEPIILKGAISLIERDKPNILIEADDLRHKTGCVDSVRNFFMERGYRGYFLLGRKVAPISAFDFAKHQNAASLDSNNHVKFNTVYVDTFVFVHEPLLAAKFDKLALPGTNL